LRGVARRQAESCEARGVASPSASGDQASTVSAIASSGNPPIHHASRMKWCASLSMLSQPVQVVVPATLAIVFLLLFFNFRNVGETIVKLSIAFTLIGGVWFLWALDYNRSVAVTIGFLALAGIAAETSVIMLVYLDQAWADRNARGHRVGAVDVRRFHDARPAADPWGDWHGSERDEAHRGADDRRHGLQHRT
jgi:multidrug efflux pump subunit AcrB